MTLAATIVRTLSAALRVLQAQGLTGAVGLTHDGVSATCYALDAADPSGAVDPAGATQHQAAATTTEVRRWRLFILPTTTAGESLPFEPAVGDQVTWGGVATSLIGVTPLRPSGDTVLAYLLDLEA